MGSVAVVDMAKDQAGADIAAARNAGVRGLVLVGGIVQVTYNVVYGATTAAWHAAGLPVAGYDWLDFTANPEAWADMACDRAAAVGMEGDMVPDFEGDVGAIWGGLSVHEWGARHIAQLDRRRARRNAYYSTDGWLADHGVDLSDPRWANRRRWIAAYGDDAVDPAPPAPRPDRDLWQYTQHGRLAGFGGDVDLSVGEADRVSEFFGGTNQGDTDVGTVEHLTPAALAEIATAVNVGGAMNNVIVHIGDAIGQLKKAQAEGDTKTTNDVVAFLTAVDTTNTKTIVDSIGGMVAHAAGLQPGELAGGPPQPQG